MPRRPAVDVTVGEGVAWVTLARDRLDADVCAGLVDACEAIDQDDGTHVVVLAGAGQAFCRGLPRGIDWLPPTWPDAVDAVARCTRPVIACLTGPVEDFGVALALACDLRVAASTAVLRLREAATGRLPGGGVTQRLPRMVGPSRALDLVLLGTAVPARQAFDWGLVSRVAAPGRVRATAARLARELASRGPLALRLAKETVVRALDLPLADGVRLEHDLYVLLQTTADRAEGIDAFRSRRRPRFSGR